MVLVPYAVLWRKPTAGRASLPDRRVRLGVAATVEGAGEAPWLLALLAALVVRLVDMVKVGALRGRSEKCWGRVEFGCSIDSSQNLSPREYSRDNRCLAGN